MAINRTTITTALSLSEIDAALAVLPRGLLYASLERARAQAMHDEAITFTSVDGALGIFVDGRRIGTLSQYGDANGRAFWQAYMNGANHRIRAKRFDDAVTRVKAWINGNSEKRAVRRKADVNDLL